MATAMQPAEIQFAQRLASNEKGIRDRAVKKLRQYISVKTQETGGFSQEELLKLWKGLFYCLWVQDEAVLQEELANTISQLVHVVNNSEAQHLFIQTFWQTMNREWKGIDKLRLDKYYLLLRLVLRQSFEVLKRNGWEESGIQLFLDVLTKEVLHPESQSPNGMTFHFIDIYLDELSKVGGKELLANQNLKFIDPFCIIAAKTKDQTLVQTIARSVFEVIMDPSPFVPKEMVEEQRTKVDGAELSEVKISENEVTWRKTVSKKKPALGKHHSRKDGISDDKDQESCGACEAPGPLLKFDYKAVADRLLEITNKKSIPPFNKKCLSKLIKKFQDLSEAGSVSQFDFTETISADEDDHPTSQGRNKKKGPKPSEKAHLDKEKGNKFICMEEEENEGSTQKRKRKKKKIHLQSENLVSGAKVMSPAQNGSSEPEEKKRKDENVPGIVGMRTEAFSSTTEEGGLEHPLAVPTCNKRKRPKKKRLRVQEGVPGIAMPPAEGMIQSGPSSNPAREADARRFPKGSLQALKKKRKLSVNGSSMSMTAWPPKGKESPRTSPGDKGNGHAALSQGVKLKKMKGTPSRLDRCGLYDLSNPKTTILKKRKRVKEMLHLVEHNSMSDIEVKQIHTLGNGGAFSPLKKKKLRAAETDFVKFDTPFLPQPLFFRKPKSNSALSFFLSPTWKQLSKTPSSSKKVTFGLNRNMTAEFKKTDKSILVSPTGPSRVAFNPEQKPLHGVLKTPTRSPSTTPLAPKKVLATPPKRRPTAMDFF
ncbi:PREDICTED: ribosomal RNA processing protein 1 homolog B [Chrysochloris asiatica]|uniref:Ribosomal RNA processing protein 1 homolog B n=1 Tax=Chrysochloris asiatica TaxID=185453 RepID=A0A9B0TV65_CHRAS|nr:PREDICTED: ribosomal RNA processing protein 1 homolog B [Chrysochloris asiatica]